MMQSILSLIHETLSSPKEAADSASAAAPKSGTRGEFETILTREDPQSMRCESATRIKARSTSIDDNGNDASVSDESDDEDATTCVNVDDFAAWAITHTIAAPPLAIAAKNPSISMVAVKLPNANAAPMPLPALDRDGETIPAAALAPKTQEFAAPKTQEMDATTAQEMAAPESRAITRELAIPTAAPKTQEMPAQQSAAFIEKMARSKNATDIPPPSAIPMVSGAPPATAASSKAQPALPTNHAPVIDIQSRSNGNNNSSAKNVNPKLAPLAARFVTSAAVMTNAAILPIAATTASDPRSAMATMPTRMIATLDLRQASDARQEAADRAVNQMTLSRAADGELDIPELGRIRVDAQTRAGEVDVRITADRPETQALVASHAHDIVLDARNASIPLADLQINRSGNNAQSNFTSSHDAPKNRDNTSRDDESSEKQAPPARGATRARFVL
jgi:hypothetical protein